jgi:hypothetical protein
MLFPGPNDGGSNTDIRVLPNQSPPRVECGGQRYVTCAPVWVIRGRNLAALLVLLQATGAGVQGIFGQVACSRPIRGWHRFPSTRRIGPGSAKIWTWGQKMDIEVVPRSEPGPLCGGCRGAIRSGHALEPCCSVHISAHVVCMVERRERGFLR